MSQTIKRIKLSDKEIILVGTAHISQESINEVTSVIKEEMPDHVAIELDKQRLETLRNPDSWKELDVVKVLKNKQGFLMIANLILASFQSRMGSDVGVKPGTEMKAAIQEAENLGIPTVMVDRPVQATLKRAWAKNTLWGKCQLLSVLLSMAFSKEEISSDEIENLKNDSEMGNMMDEIAKAFPTVKEVLIDERDQYLASHIWNIPGKKVVAILGAGHLPGVEKWLSDLDSKKVSSDTEEIETIPKPSFASKIAEWIIPALIIGLIIAGFFKGGASASVNMLLKWVITNGSLAAIGSLLCLAHPLTIIVSFVAAPVASLNPFIGIGMIAGLVQAWLYKPKVEDMENLNKDACSFKGWYRNRLLKVLLIFILSSIGGSIGNFIALPSLVSSLAN